MKRLYRRVLEDLENLQRLHAVSKQCDLQLVLPDESILALNDVHNEFLRDVISQEDALGLDLKSCYYSSLAAPPFGNAATDVEIDKVSIQSDSQDGISEVSLDDIKDVMDVEETPDSKDAIDLTAATNFSRFTYWAVEDKAENTSTCKRPLYAKNKTNGVSLLEDSEAFVAMALKTASQRNVFLETPRHLLLQVAQVTSRAFFDPHYRSYLANKY